MNNNQFEFKNNVSNNTDSTKHHIADENINDSNAPVCDLKITDMELIADRLVKSNTDVTDKLLCSNEIVADKLIQSNEIVADRLLQSDHDTAANLLVFNASNGCVTSDRYTKQNRLSWISITFSVLTFIILLCFTVAFFKYAIVVTTR